MYTPNNDQVYTSAFSGAMSALGAYAILGTLKSASNYATITSYAGAFAQEFDTRWALTATTQLDIELIQTACEIAWLQRFRTQNQWVGGTPTVPVTYRVLCDEIIEILVSSALYYSGQSIVPPAIPVAGVEIEDEGTPLSGGPFGTLNFVGGGVVASPVTGIATITINGGVNVDDEGTPLVGNPFPTLNFVGAGVTASPLTGVATITIPGGTVQAVVFDDATPSDDINIRSNRKVNQSPVNNVKTGQTNLGSDTTGVTAGCNGDYGTIGGGDANILVGHYSTVSGGRNNNSSASAGYGFIGGGRNHVLGGAGFEVIAGGDGNTTDGIGYATIVGGSGNLVNGAYGFCGAGLNNTVSGRYAGILAGTSCTASGQSSRAHGSNATASRSHQDSFGTSTGQRCVVPLTVQTSGVTAGELLQADSGEFTAVNGKSYKINVDVIVAKANANGLQSSFTRILTCHATGNVLVLDNETVIDDYGNGRTLTFSVNGSDLILRNSCVGLVGETANWYATFSFLETACFP